MKILIVLHDMMLLTSVRILLHQQKKTIEDIILASHSYEGEKILATQKIDVLIMDLEVESFDGFDLLISSIKKFPKLQLMILSDTISKQHPFFSSFKYFKKALFIAQLPRLLTDINADKVHLSTVSHMLIGDFFCLIQLMKKTCLLEVK